MKIRKALTSDKESIYKIHISSVRKGCKDFYKQEQIDGWLKNKTPEGYIEAIEKDEMFVIEDEDVIIGFGHAVPGEVMGIFVDPDNYKKGVGKEILAHAIKLASKDHKTIKMEATLNAENFYIKNGFEKVNYGTFPRNGVDIPIVNMKYTI